MCGCVSEGEWLHLSNFRTEGRHDGGYTVMLGLEEAGKYVPQARASYKARAFAVHLENDVCTLLDARV